MMTGDLMTTMNTRQLTGGYSVKMLDKEAIYNPKEDNEKTTAFIILLRMK